MPALSDHLAPAGPLARALGPTFEPRPQQVEMAAAVAAALEQKATLIVEAGTGVGKSFAYLIPAIARIIATAGNSGGEKIVIATNTIALQEQLLNKDIPLMRRMFAPTGPDGRPDESKAPFKAELVKGRGNYLSIRRLQMASERQERLFLDEPARRSLHVIEDWAYSTTDGTLATLPPLERAGIWDRVQSDSGNCMGKKCPTFQKCFYQNARRRMESANLLICNHAVFFADLALRAAGEGARGFLPDYHHVILDEAHQIEEVASDHFGRSLTEGRIRHLLSALWQSKRNRGYLATLRVKGEGAQAVERAIQLADAAADAADHFFESLLHYTRGEITATRIPRKRESDEPIVPNIIAPAFRELTIALKRLKDSLLIDEDKYELNSYSLRAAGIADDAEALLNQHTPGCAYWIEVKTNDPGGDSRAGRIRIELACSPIEVAPILKQHLFHGNFSVILTSATLTTSGWHGTPCRVPSSPAQGGGGASSPAVAGVFEVEDPPWRGGGGASAQPEPDFDPDVSPPRPEAPSPKPFLYALTHLGCTDARTLALGSPFDHAAQVELHADATMPDPRAPRYLDELTARIDHHVAATDGGAFVLFTSFKTMHDAARRLRPILEARNMPVWVHGLDGPRSHILDQFRQNDRSVLLGTTSFWQGVDVPGRALRNVIITRLPFDPPDRPLTQARNELIESRGGNPFMEDSLPRAVIRFKQGFGRLIRSATDTGRVVVLDPRILTARYGKQFLNALPDGIKVIRFPLPLGGGPA